MSDNINKNENQELKNEDIINFSPLYKAWTQEVGINSSILVHHYYDSRESKVVIKFGVQKGGFDFEESVEMMNDIVTYQKYLERHNVPLPRIEDIMLEYNPVNSKAAISKTSPWTGNDIEKVVESCNHITDKNKIADLVTGMCKIMLPVAENRLSGWETEVGIDPRASNFTQDRSGKIWFVDLFPPRYRKKGEPIVEWPEPKNKLGKELGYFKHFDVRGIILCTTAQLARVKPELKEFFENIVFEGFKKAMTDSEYREFQSELADTPWMRLRRSIKQTSFDSQGIEKIIRNAANQKVFGVNYYIYILRELALELAQAGLISRKEMKEFFKDSHFEDKLPDENIEALEDKLVGLVHKKYVTKL